MRILGKNFTVSIKQSKPTLVEAVLEELRERGLEPVDEKPRVAVGGAKIAFIDPKGTRNVHLQLYEKHNGG